MTHRAVFESKSFFSSVRIRTNASTSDSKNSEVESSINLATEIFSKEKLSVIFLKVELSRQFSTNQIKQSVEYLCSVKEISFPLIFLHKLSMNSSTKSETLV